MKLTKQELEYIRDTMLRRRMYHFAPTYVKLWRAYHEVLLNKILAELNKLDNKV